MFDVADLRAYQLAIIIPEFNQPQLAIEAIEDALAQTDCPLTAVVLANDASDFAEIDEIANAYMSTSRNFFYLKARKNRGLAGNRNAAVQFCLTEFPELKALTFLDSDDRLHPRTLSHFFRSLEESRHKRTKVGWIYTDPYQFGGIHGYLRKPTRYKILWHMLANSNSATSLIDVAVFKEGCFFDETMKKGSEDWAFWLSAVSKGFVGEFVLPPTFGYRRRAESMSSDATFHRQEIVDYVWSQFPELFNRPKIFSLQDEELPPYALMHVERYDEVDLFSDTRARTSRLSFAELIASLVEQRADPLSHGIRCICIGHTNGISRLKESGLLNWLLWASSNNADDAAYSVRYDCAEDGFDTSESQEGHGDTECDVLLFSYGALKNFNAKTSSFRKEIRLRLTGKCGTPAFTPRKFFREVFLSALDSADFSRAELAKQHLALWKPNGAVGVDVVDHLLGTQKHLPLLRPTGQIVVGVAVGPSNFSPGNIETLLKFLRQFADHSSGFRMVLYFAEKDFQVGLKIGRGLGAVDIFFLPADLTSSTRHDEKHYLGSRMTPWMVFSDKKASLGPFVGLDAFFNLSNPELSALAFPLQKRGVVTVAVVAADARTSHNRGRGHSFRSPVFGQTPFIENVLAYEHAYQHIVTASADDVPWLIAKGLPRDKIKTAPHLWSFDLRRARNTFEHTTVAGDINDSTGGVWAEILDR